MSFFDLSLRSYEENIENKITPSLSSLKSKSVTHKMTYHVSFICKLINSCLHSFLTVFCKVKIFYNFPLTVFTSDWIGEAKSPWYSV